MNLEQIFRLAHWDIYSYPWWEKATNKIWVAEWENDKLGLPHSLQLGPVHRSDKGSYDEPAIAWTCATLCKDADELLEHIWCHGYPIGEFSLILSVQTKGIRWSVIHKDKGEILPGGVIAEEEFFRLALHVMEEIAPVAIAFDWLEEHYGVVSKITTRGLTC